MEYSGDFLFWIAEVTKVLVALSLGTIGYIRWKQYKESKKRMRYDAMSKSALRAEKIIMELARLHGSKFKNPEKYPRKAKALISAYIDLCEENLYYIENGLIPESFGKLLIRKMKKYLLRYNDRDALNELCIFHHLDQPQEAILSLINQEDLIAKFIYNNNLPIKKAFVY